MTIRAYSELYLNDAIRNLANAFDYAMNVCGLEPDWFISLFLQSNLSTQFERGNPAVISGRSGEELVKEILSAAYPEEKFPDSTFSEGRSPEFWAGWALAQYQWFSGKRFRDIFERIPLCTIIAMYPTFHEMDISRFNESMNRQYNEAVKETKLSRIRESRGISQAELARLSGVNLRSIQLYEQRVNHIDRAQAQALYKLSRVLGCSIEDLLENPETI